MKRILFVLGAMIFVAQFYILKPSVQDYPVLKYYDTINTTATSPFSATEIHNFWNDLGDTTNGVYHYAFYGRNFAWDTLYIDSYPIVNKIVNYTTPDTTYLFGFNRTISNIPMYLDTLGNSTLLWRSKDSPCRVFKQLVKL